MSSKIKAAKRNENLSPSFFENARVRVRESSPETFLSALALHTAAFSLSLPFSPFSSFSSPLSLPQCSYIYARFLSLSLFFAPCESSSVGRNIRFCAESAFDESVIGVMYEKPYLSWGELFGSLNSNLIKILDFEPANIDTHSKNVICVKIIPGGFRRAFLN